MLFRKHCGGAAMLIHITAVIIDMQMPSITAHYQLLQAMQCICV
jgi:hypothetical protein